VNFPVWDLPFAHGLLIAVVATLHVYVAHFAVGGGLYLVVTEHLARRRNDEALLATLQRHSRFFLLLTLVFGAMTGVGIWFTIGLINPGGTSALIRTFVWGWAIEWTFFMAEIAAAMVYYYGWKRLSPGKHLAVGWIYFANAWMSMVVINGILSFQLTPGDWLATRGFWDGFFNPTYWSSLFARTFYAIALGGLFALWTAARSTSAQESAQRPWLVRFSGTWAMIGVILTAACTLWWWNDVPAEVRALTRGDLPIASAVTQWTPLLTLVLAVLVIIGPLALPRIVTRPYALLVLLAGFAAMGAAEWTREGIRKPWVVVGYIYSNGILASDVDTLREQGIVANAQWVDPSLAGDPVAHGKQIWRAVCQNCHAETGYNGMQGRVQHWDEPFTAAMVSRLHYTRRMMPPWIGTDEEASAVAAYLMTLKPANVPPLTRGEDVFAVRCSPCHSVDGFRPIKGLVEGLSAEELVAYMEDMESDEMPAFTGTPEEAELLATYLESLNATPSTAASASTRDQEGAR
jgi:mono/diheme cytochrome c family protein/cytochrome bd-type quinol oxidase subunit 1